MEPPLFFISAGDPSADNATVRLINALRELLPDSRFMGLGGPRMNAAGQEQLASPRDLAVLGFWEVARKYGYFRRLMHRCVDEIASRRPAAVVLVDYPGFNLRLAARIRQLGIPIIYYISSQVWAWGHRRVKQIRNLVDLMLLILPFEEPFYEASGVSCRYVGHYLLEDIPESLINSTPPTEAGLAVLPGSREQEVVRMLPTMARAAERWCRTSGGKAVIAGITGLVDYDSLLSGIDRSRLEIVFDHPRDVVSQAALALVASGTATLETGIINRPMVVVYKTGWLTFQIARRLVKLDTIALVNLVLGQKVAPELIQHQAVPERIAGQLNRLWNDNSAYESCREAFGRLPEILKGTGASRRAASEIANFLTARGGER